ncbi:MAG TPA: hypothetical protein VMT00_05535 [Thermoanaerobaculia bacterium]|nr:hypothetical protein [Thermoanaerobaculia bacterium]
MSDWHLSETSAGESQCASLFTAAEYDDVESFFDARGDEPAPLREFPHLAARLGIGGLLEDSYAIEAAEMLRTPGVPDEPLEAGLAEAAGLGALLALLAEPALRPLRDRFISSDTRARSRQGVFGPSEYFASAR